MKDASRGIGFQPVGKTIDDRLEAYPTEHRTRGADATPLAHLLNAADELLRSDYPHPQSQPGGLPV